MMDLDDMITKQTILLVDNNLQHIDALSEILCPYYKVKAAHNASVAFSFASAADKPDLILLAITVSDIDAYAICKQLKIMPETAEIPVVFICGKGEIEDEERGFALGAVDFITKPYSPVLILARVSAHLKLSNQKSHLMSLVQERTHELEKTRVDIVQSLVRAAGFKDNDTGLHVIRMSWYARFLAKKVTGNNTWSELLYNAAPMHDIGKIGIPDYVLLKTGKLNPDEWAIMQKHVDYGVEILGKHESDLLGMAVEVVQYHHEKWDGTGYPAGISGEDIPLSARIVAIVDVFDALTSERPHKNAWTVEKSMAFIESESGKHFDPELLPHFKACLPKILKIKEQYADRLENTEVDD